MIIGQFLEITNQVCHHTLHMQEKNLNGWRLDRMLSIQAKTSFTGWAIQLGPAIEQKEARCAFGIVRFQHSSF